MSKINAVRSNSWKKQPRDRLGRFSSAFGKVINKEKNNIKEQAEETLKNYLKDKGFLSGRYPITEKGKTYPELVKEKGEDGAKKKIKQIIYKRLKKEKDIEEIEKAVIEERESIKRSGTILEKYTLKAWQRIHPEKQLDTTLDNFKRYNPKEYTKMLKAYSRELDLDEKLKYVNTINRGKKLSENIRKAVTEEERLQRVSELYDDLKKTGLDRQSAIKIVDSKKFDSSIDKTPGNRQITAQTAVEFFEITKGEGSKSLDTFKLSTSRAYANRNEKSLNIGDFTNASTIFHELGHHLEFSDDRIKEAANDFLIKRAKTDKPDKLNNIVNSSRYNDDELAYRGKYISPYVGKVYSDRSTEVISMGMQYFTNPQSMLELYKADRSHFEFILGILRPDLD